MAQAQGEGPSGAGGGTGSDPWTLQLRVGRYKSWEQKFKKKKKEPILFSILFYLGSISCATDSRTLEVQGGVGWGSITFFLKGKSREVSWDSNTLLELGHNH